MPLPGGHQPLQPAVRDLPAHLRGTRAAGRHELGAVHPHRRPGAEHRRAWCCTASASRCWCEDLPRMVALPEGARRPRAVQHQRHLAQPEERPALCRGGLDELRVSLDAAEPEDLFSLSGARTTSTASCATSAPSPPCSATGLDKPQDVSLWLTGLRETIEQLPAFVRLAARHRREGEVHLQRLVFLPEQGPTAWPRPDQALFESVHGG